MSTPSAPRAGREDTLTACPKSMSFGPCCGVARDGSCEVSPHPCVFLDRPLPVPVPAGRVGSTAAATAASSEVLAIMADRPLIMTEFPVRPMRSHDVPRIAEALAGSADAVLSGDAGHTRTQFPPAYRAVLMAREGVRVWMGLNTRDRNRVALEGELAALRDAGVAGVHCVTGDHTRSGDRPDAQPVFDLESTTLLPLARERGLLTSFAESPAAPPVAVRGARVREKQRAGGQLCLLQHCGGVGDVAAFVRRCSDAGADVPILPGVPLVIDDAGLDVLAGFAAATLPNGFLKALAAAGDVRSTGIRLAIEYGRAVLAVPGVRGVIIAGGARAGGELDYARALAVVAAELGGGS